MWQRAAANSANSQPLENISLEFSGGLCALREIITMSAFAFAPAVAVAALAIETGKSGGSYAARFQNGEFVFGEMVVYNT
ncbi:MAG: hypothetical protein LBJ10_01375 [Clostridiales bacterium]|jgi:hypothetical protein|nr:hypothetical protein [Clostridiales bacterium]